MSKKYCCYCQNEDNELCLLHCDSMNKGWYEFDLFKWCVFILVFLWDDIKYFFNYYITEIKAWWILKCWDKDWLKDWKELLK